MTTLEYGDIREENVTAADRRLAAIRWARRAFRTGNVVILDGETISTVPGSDARRLCELSVIDTAGIQRLDAKVHPGVPIDPGAQRAHHLADEMVSGALSFRWILPDLIHATYGMVVAAYNARSVYQLILSEIRRVGMDPEHLEDPATWHCISRARSDWLGQPHHYLPPPVAHGALGRCHAALDVLRVIAEDSERATVDIR